MKTKIFVLLTFTLFVASCFSASPPSTTSTTTSTSTTSTSTTSTSTTTSTTLVDPEPNIVFFDTFNELSPTRWKAYHSTYGDGNNELQCHTPNNVRPSENGLQIIAKRESYRCPSGTNLNREWTGGFIGSRDVGRYYPLEGRYEIMAKIPHGQGLWPAFWLRHRNGAGQAEVDVFEYFHAEQPGIVRQSLHLRDTRLYNRVKQATFFEDPSSEPQFHLYAVEIRVIESGIEFKFFVDDILTAEYIDTNPLWNTANPNETWDMAINLSVGGDWIGHPDDPLGYLRNVNRCSRGGTPPNMCNSSGIQRWTGQEAEYVVQYVKVTELS